MFKPYQKLVFFDFETTGIDVNSDPSIGCFPIELAMMVTDYELNIIGDPFHTLIRWDVFDTEYFKDNWNNFEATKIHGIKLEEIIDCGILHNAVNSHNKQDVLLSHNIEMYLEELKIHKKDQLTLVSDNPYFDMALMKKLYNVKIDGGQVKFPFHYNCFSPLMLFDALEMNIKNCHPHRAMGDVNGLYKSCVIAFDRLGKFNKKEKINVK